MHTLARAYEIMYPGTRYSDKHLARFNGDRETAEAAIRDV